MALAEIRAKLKEQENPQVVTPAAATTQFTHFDMKEGETSNSQASQMATVTTLFPERLMI